MATTTTNLGLTKPAYADDADIAVINGNMDILDTKIGAVGNTDLQSQVTTLNTNLANIITSFSTSSIAIDIPNSKDFMIVFGAPARWIYIVHANGAGDVSYTPIGSPPASISVTTNTNKITISYSTTLAGFYIHS